jgi:hypothetical protein
MSLDLQRAHALLDRLAPAKLGAVRSSLEVMLRNDSDEPVTNEDRHCFRDGIALFAQRGI